jgi:hypothetical protein
MRSEDLAVFSIPKTSLSINEFMKVALPAADERIKTDRVSPPTTESIETLNRLSLCRPFCTIHKVKLHEFF